MRSLLLLPCLVAAAFGACANNNNNPDGSRDHLFFKNCNSADVIQVQSVSVTDGQGNVNYPINVNKPIYITAKSINNGGTYQKNKVDVKLYSWNKLFFQSKCQWNLIPTFGLLSNLDGCSIGKNCPLNQGALNLVVDVDLSRFAQIINIITANNPYKIEIHIKNDDDSQHEEIACLAVEALIKKGN